MNYQELRDFALRCSLEHHLCNVDELLPTKTPDEILEMVDNKDEAIIPWEPFDHFFFYEEGSLASEIEDMRGVYMFNFMHVLNQVNGDEWVINFKAGA